MRYELADHEWAASKPMLPNKPRGVPRVNDRRVLNGIFWVLRSGAPWRDLPRGFGPYTTCYNRFVRWRRAGVWSRIMDALAAAHDGVNLGGQPASRPAHGLLPISDDAGTVLMHADNGRINHLHRCIMRGRQRGYLGPDARPSPANEAIIKPGMRGY
jgi:transposase